MALGLGEGAIAWRVRHRPAAPDPPGRVCRRPPCPSPLWAADGRGARLRRRSGPQPSQCRRASEDWARAPRSSRSPHPAIAGHRDILVHRAEVPPEHRGIIEGIPVTIPARTLIDLADVLTRRGLERAIDEAEFLRLDHTGLRPSRGAAAPGCSPRCSPGTWPAPHVRAPSWRRCSSPSAAATSSPSPRRTRTWTATRSTSSGEGRDWSSSSTAAPRTTPAARSSGSRPRRRAHGSGYRVMRFTQRRLEREPAAVADELRRAGAPVAPGRRSRSRAARRRRPRP